jgi:hypothetical protein
VCLALNMKVASLLFAVCLLFSVLNVQGDHIMPFRGVDFGSDSEASMTKGATVDSVVPDWSVLSTGGAPNWITINGCGFRTYSEAVCVWDFEVTSPVSYIISDTEIKCQVPTRQLSEFQSLPAISRLDVVFDGNANQNSGNAGNSNGIVYAGPFQWGPNIDCEVPLVSKRGPTSGGSISINGRGFNDAALTGLTLNVWFDSAVASGCSASSTVITCSSIPSVNEIHRNALVSVTWGANSFWDHGDTEVYLHSTELYHYGPIAEDVYGCTGAYGGDLITISGVGFDDALLKATRPLSPDSINDNQPLENLSNGTDSGTLLAADASGYLVRVYPSASVSGSDNGAAIDYLEAWGTRESDTEITFVAPNFFLSSDMTSEAFYNAMVGSSARVELYYRQTNRLQAVELSGASFVYGPTVTDVVTPHLHAGGGETNWCANGCFKNYTVASMQVGGTNICGGTTTISSSKTQVCCSLVDVDRCNVENDLQALEVTLTANWLTNQEIDLVTGDILHFGPILESIADDNDYLGHTYLSSPTVKATGENFRYTAGSTGTPLGGWTALTGSCGSGSCNNLNTAQTGVSIDSDVGMTFTWTGPADMSNMNIGRGFTVTFDQTPASVSCNRGFSADFGPYCSSITPFSGNVAGGDTITVDADLQVNSGTKYAAQVRLLTPRGDCSVGGNAISCDDAYEDAGTLTSSKTFTTPSFMNANNLNRGRRYWGQVFEVVLMLNSQADSLYGGSTIVTWPSGFDSTISTSFDSQAFLTCGAYRFGPVTEEMSPCKGPLNGGTSVTVDGRSFDDAWYKKTTTLARAGSPHIVTFGEVLGSWSTGTVGTNSLTQTVLDGAASRFATDGSRDASVTVIFDACNMTAPIQNTLGDEISVHWGPRFMTDAADSTFGIEVSDGSNFIGGGDDQSSTGHIYGACPLNNGDGYGPNDNDQYIYLNILGLDEYCSSDGNFCENVRVLIDGVPTNWNTYWSNTQLEVPVIGRPFGTEASVCVEFGLESYANEHGDPFSVSTEKVNWKNVICAEEKLFYTPKYVGRNRETSPSSGGLTVTYEFIGLNNFWHTDVAAKKAYVGGYLATIDSDTDNEIVITNPTGMYEFNTMASVRFQFWPVVESAYFDPALGECATLDGEKDNHWSVWAADYHFGPTCEGITASASRGSIQTPILNANGVFSQESSTLIGTGLKDCVVSECTTNGLTDDADDCRTPQYSNQKRRINTPTGFGTPLCMHRQIYVLYTLDKDTVPVDTNGAIVQAHAHVNSIVYERDADSLDGSSITDTSIDIIVPPHGTSQCGYANFALYFPDALVSTEAQRVIQCEDSTYTYGPSVTGATGVWFRSDISTIYGFGYDYCNMLSGCTGDDTTAQPRPVHEDWKLTVTGSGWNDEFFTDNSDETGRTDNLKYRPVVLLNNVVPSGDYIATHTYTDSANSVVRSVAKANFGVEAPISVAWYQRAASGNSITTSSQICLMSSGWTFHYGPIIAYSDRDDCVDSVELSTADLPDEVEITGHAFECCGFQQLGTSPVFGQTSTQCLFQQRGRDAQVRSSNNGVGGWPGAFSSVSCNVPLNTDPAMRMFAFGVMFGRETPCPDAAGACLASGSNIRLSLTVLDPSYNDYDHMDICYGPKWTPQSTTRRWSGEVGCPDPSGGILPGSTYRDGNRIGVTGMGFTQSSAFYNDTDVACVWSATSITEGEIMNDGSVRCEIDTFRKQCGDSDDTFHLRFLNKVTSTNYEQKFFIRDQTKGVPTFTPEGSVLVEFTVEYGPSYQVNGVSGNGIVTDYDWMDGAIRVFTNTRLPSVPTLDFDVDRTEDWGCSSGDDVFSRYEDAYILCLYENARDPKYDEDDTLLYLDYYGEVDSCQVPSGHFGAMSNVRVIIDPHYDEWTHFNAPEFYNMNDDHMYRDYDTLTSYSSWNGEDDLPFWHWTPYTTIVSKDWSQMNGLEPVSVYGEGFWEYQSVICRFSGVDAVQGDILTDNIVVCQTPVNHAPASTAFTLTFCHNQDGCSCEYGCDATPDEIPAGAFLFTGITDVWPVYGPVHGNTPVTFTGVGLDRYLRVECVWHLKGGIQTFAMAENRCVSPESSQEGLVLVEVVGYWYHWSGSDSNYLGFPVFDFYFDYGFPSVDSVTPLSTEVGDQTDVVLTITGNFFNGGLPDATVNGTGVYECKWQVGESDRSDDPRELGSQADFGRIMSTQGYREAFTDSRYGRDIDSYQIICPAPATFSRIGAYPFEVTFSDDRSAKGEFNFDAVASSVLSLSGWESDAENYHNSTDTFYVPNIAFDTLLTIFGSGLFGGRMEDNGHTSGYMVRFGESTANEDVTAYAVGYLLDDESGVWTYPVPRDLWKNTTGANGFADIPVAVSVDGGYTWSEEIFVTYRRDADILDCVENASSTFILSFFAALFSFLVVLF